MSEALLDAFRHNAWATRRLLEFCRGLTDEQCNADAVGTYGSILETLKHTLGAEAYYSFVLRGQLPDWPRFDEEAVDIDEMERWAAELASFWEEALSRPIDADAILVRRHESGSLREVRTGILLAQALHHANVHREQVSTILTALGISPPDLDVWSYGTATARHSFTPHA